MHTYLDLYRDLAYKEKQELELNSEDISVLYIKPDLEECFKIFPIIHKIIASKPLLIEATQEVLKNFTSKGLGV